MLRLLIGTLLAPVWIITSGCHFSLSRSIRYKVLFFVGGNHTYSIPTFFGGMVFCHNEFINNNGVIYHELGHCRCWSAINGKHGNVHAHFLPAESELAADAYAIKHGYGLQLIDALVDAGTSEGHLDGAIRIKVAREQMGLN
jgi:hypothetical protein